MFDGIQKKYRWVLPTVVYPSAKALIREFDKEVLAPALAMEAAIAKEPAMRTIAE